MAAHIGRLHNPRMKAMVVPREHGAWGMMLVPLATGAMVATRSGVNGGALTLFIVAAMSLFWLRTPVESWLGISAVKATSAAERRTVAQVVVALGAVTAASVLALFANGHNRGLLIIGAITALSFTAQAAVKKFGRKGRMPTQVIGAIGLTSTAAGAYYVATGRLDQTALALWLANWLFAGDQIHFVQVRIHGSRAASLEDKMELGTPFFLGQVALVGTIVAAYTFGVFPETIALAFIPVLLRGTLWFVRRREPLDVHKLGFSELRQALLFGVLLTAVFLV